MSNTETQAEKHLREVMQKVKENPEVREAKKQVLKEKVQASLKELHTAIQQGKTILDILQKANTFRFHAQSLLEEDGTIVKKNRGRPKKK